MSPSRKGIILAVLQLAIVASLAAKYAIDRARFPRVWARTVVYDPNLPIRGRYLSAQLRVDADLVYENSELPMGINFFQKDIYLHVENGRLVASPAPTPTGLRVTRVEDAHGRSSDGPQRAGGFFTCRSTASILRGERPAKSYGSK